MTRLAIIIVSYNSRSDLENALRSLTAPPPTVTHEIVVVDNASTDSTPAWVRERWPRIRLIASESNLGFAQGNNLGVRSTSSDLVLFVNPDTIVTAGAVDRLVSILESQPDVVDRRAAHRGRTWSRRAVFRRDDLAVGRVPTEVPGPRERSWVRTDYRTCRSHDAADPPGGLGQRGLSSDPPYGSRRCWRLRPAVLHVRGRRRPVRGRARARTVRPLQRRAGSGAPARALGGLRPSTILGTPTVAVRSRSMRSTTRAGSPS